NTLINTALQQSLPRPLPMTPDELLAALTPTAVLLWLAATVAAVGFYIVFAIAWHRRCLLPHESATVGAALRWRARHWRFFAMTLTLAIGAILVVFIVNTAAGLAIRAATGGGGIGVIVSIVLVFLVLTIFARFLPVFPAIAVDDRRMTLAAAWRLTRGNGMTLFMMLFTVSIVVAMATQLVNAAWLALLGDAAAAGSLLAIGAILLLGQCLTFIGIAASTTIVSIAYRELAAGAGGGGMSGSTGSGGTTV
ncbi:MAG: hypothetical protein VW644_03435, partial [Alphaproteobacteria bacterium]